MLCLFGIFIFEFGHGNLKKKKGCLNDLENAAVTFKCIYFFVQLINQISFVYIVQHVLKKY